MMSLYRRRLSPERPHHLYATMSDTADIADMRNATDPQPFSGHPNLELIGPVARRAQIGLVDDKSIVSLAKATCSSTPSWT